jgi:hypothetical protein
MRSASLRSYAPASYNGDSCSGKWLQVASFIENFPGSLFAALREWEALEAVTILGLPADRLRFAPVRHGGSTLRS